MAEHFFFRSLIIFQALVGVFSHLDYAQKPWLDAEKPIPERVAALLKTLTIEQKISQTFATHTGEHIVRNFEKSGVGAVKYMSAFSSNNVSENIALRNKLQSDFLEYSNVPISFINEGLHGGAPSGTIFPMPITQGCSWNVSLVSSIASVIAAEARSIGVDTVFAPVVNMMTDPRFGRMQEGYSENPIITAHMGEASVIGLQHTENVSAYLDNKSVASLGKHYAAYGSATGGLNGGPAAITKRTLFDVFLRPWKAMGAAGLRSTMPAHNTVQDIPCHANRYLIDEILRNKFGFGNGVALSDCNDIGVLVDFRLAANRSHAAALALKAGVDWDLQCGEDPTKFVDHHIANDFRYLMSLAEGLVDESDLDKIVSHILTHKFANGLFDEAPIDPSVAKSLLDNEEHRALARSAAEQGTVMLINRNKALPLGSLDGLKIALLGPTASSECNCSDAVDVVIGSYALSGAHVVTLDEALRNANATVKWAPGMKSAAGPPGSGVDDELRQTAVALAQDADVAILMLGDVEGSGTGSCGEWHDRDDLDLQGGQLDLLNAVSAVAKKTIVVLVHGRPQTFGQGNAALNRVDGMLATFRPGEEFGNAISLLSGSVSPSGKLTQSWPRSVGQVGGGANPWLQAVRGKWVANKKTVVDADGRWYDAYSASLNAPTPLFYFGYGLSYTNFSYTGLKVLKANNMSNSGLLAEVTVQNIGPVSASEIVQVYVQDPVGLPFVPYWKRLVAFTRIYIEAGETVTVKIPIRYDDLSLYSNDEEPVLTLYPGDYKVTAGGGSNSDSISTLIHINS